MGRELLIRFAVVCGIGYVLVVLWLVLAVKSKLTKNESTAIGFLLGTGWAVAFFYPDMRVDTLIPSLVVIITSTSTFRLTTPFLLWSAETGRRIGEQRRSRDQQRGRQNSG